MTRVLILTAAIGYKPQQVLAFTRSLEHIGFTGTVLMLIDRHDAELFEKAMPSLVELMPIQVEKAEEVMARMPPALSALLRPDRSGVMAPDFLFRALNLDFMWLSDFLAAANHPSVGRYMHYAKAVFARKDRFDHVILCDSRDLIFQTDPSKELQDINGVRFALENPFIRMIDEVTNTQWFTALYGEQAAQRHAGKRIACGGVQFGTMAGISVYLQKMFGEIVRLSYLTQRKFGFDQSMMNRLGWDGEIPDLTWGENLQHEIANLNGYTSDELEPLLHNGVLLRQDNGQPVMIVHQFDRVGRVGRPLLAKLGLTPGEIGLEMAEN